MSEELRRPVPGEMVWYQNDGRGGYSYYVPAVVSVTTDNLVRQGVKDGKISDLDSGYHLHLTVFGPEGVYHELNVPHDDDASPRSWRWPDYLR